MAEENKETKEKKKKIEPKEAKTKGDPIVELIA
jgi:hypothetical protein